MMRACYSCVLEGFKIPAQGQVKVIKGCFPIWLRYHYREAGLTCSILAKDGGAFEDAEQG